MSIDTESLEIKSTSYNVPVLVVFSTDLKQIEISLQEKISLAPDFFKNTPVLIDLEKIKKQRQSIDLAALIKYLRKINLIPVGVSGGNDEQNKLAIASNIPLHTIRGATLDVSRKNESNKEVAPAPVMNETLLTQNQSVENMFISQPVRSGQRIYSKGDLTILSNVSAGAEVMAEGHIHVYGALRGRALAGVQGNKESRIFCSGLEAELISIAGNYKTSEEMDIKEKNVPVQIFLQEQALIINNL